MLGWVKMGKNIKADLPHGEKRAWTTAEAKISFLLDLDAGKEITFRGYSRLWKWSHRRVKRHVLKWMEEQQLIDNAPPVLTPTHHKRTTNAPLKPNNGGGLRDGAHHERTTNAPQPVHYYKTKTKTKKTTTTVPKSKDYTPGFLSFWAEYPRKLRKVDTFAIWQRDGLEAQTEKIVEAVKVQKDSPQWARDEGKYIPHPTTWLNQCRYEDEGELPVSFFKPTTAAPPRILPPESEISRLSRDKGWWDA